MSAALHTETREGFTLEYRAFPETDVSPEDSFDIQEGDDTLERIEDGTYAWFRVEITASRAGIVLATAHLGACCYTSEEAFVTESGYYADLCNEAIAEAKTKIGDLAAPALALLGRMLCVIDMTDPDHEDFADSAADTVQALCELEEEARELTGIAAVKKSEAEHRCPWCDVLNAPEALRCIACDGGMQ